MPNGEGRPPTPPPPAAPVRNDGDSEFARKALADSRSIWRLRREIEHIQSIIAVKQAAGESEGDDAEPEAAA
jgi:hypothetical protein